MMKVNKRVSIFLCLLVAVGCLTGCAGHLHTRRKPPQYPVPDVEASWIREGKPIEFEGELWYPERNVEIFRDEEIDLMGEHQGTLFFVDKVDIRPFRRLYTKFGRNKFRSFEKK
jgi:hypothetical protein